jgi:hypothetical protein
MPNPRSNLNPNAKVFIPRNIVNNNQQQQNNQQNNQQHQNNQQQNNNTANNVNSNNTNTNANTRTQYRPRVNNTFLRQIVSMFVEPQPDIFDNLLSSIRRSLETNVDFQNQEQRLNFTMQARELYSTIFYKIQKETDRYGITNFVMKPTEVCTVENFLDCKAIAYNETEWLITKELRLNYMNQRNHVVSIWCSYNCLNKNWTLKLNWYLLDPRTNLSKWVPGKRISCDTELLLTELNVPYLTRQLRRAIEALN